MTCLGRAKRLIAACACCMVLLPVVAVGQIEKIWVKLDPGSFNDDVNWNPVGVPGPLDTAKFNEDNPNTVSFSQGVANFLLLVDHGSPTFELATNEYMLEGAIVGDDPGDVAVLTLLDGTVTVASPGSTRFRIGKDAGSDGTLRVSTDSTFSSSRPLFIGDAGSGALLIVNGGAASTSAAVATFIADDAGSTGTLTVDGPGSTWDAVGSMFLGNEGSGTMNVLNGGSGSALMVVRIGDDPGSDGTLVIDGVDSNLDVTGQSVVGNFGSGSVSVTNGGFFSTADLTLADEVDSSGVATVSGTGSGLTDSVEINIGKNGSGSLTITDGATVTGVIGIIGDNTGSVGTVTIDGAGSAWNNSGTLDVGDSGQGTLTVTDGAVTSALSVKINSISRVQGNGLVEGDVTNRGVVSPEGLGQLTIQGDYEQDSTGRLNIQLANPGGDMLNVSGSASLNGTINLSFAEGSTPVGEFTILTATPVIEKFDQVNKPAGVILTYTSNSVIATTQPGLTVTKIVQNDDGGTMAVTDFEIMIDGGPVTSGASNQVTVGVHTVSEIPVAGYTGVIGGDCASDGTVSLALGEARSCTITNTDDQPTLTVTKIVQNGGIGTLEVADFEIKIDGVPVTSGISNEVNAGLHTVSETPVANYTGVIGGDCALDGTVTLALGQSGSCTITNTAQEEPAIFVDGFE